jgi:hypothetical protein
MCFSNFSNKVGVERGHEYRKRGLGDRVEGSNTWPEYQDGRG